jgi:hypothetical protein
MKRIISLMIAASLISATAAPSLAAKDIFAPLQLPVVVKVKKGKKPVKAPATYSFRVWRGTSLMKKETSSSLQQCSQVQEAYNLGGDKNWIKTPCEKDLIP